MKKIVKKAIESGKTLEEWAFENDFVLPEKKQKPMLLRKPFIQIACAAVILILFIGVTLPFILTDTENPPIVYSSQDATTISLTLEDIYEMNDLVLFNPSQILFLDRVNMDCLTENEELTMSYNLFSLMIVTTDGQCLFEVDYIIRPYHLYNFASYENYSVLESSMNIGNIKIDYKIKNEGRNESQAYVAFALDNIEYFMRVTEVEGIAEVTEETLTVLLSDLLSNVHQN